MSAGGSRIDAALGRSELARSVRAALAPLPGEAWIVGGAIRDALTGRPIGDLDVATEGDPEAAARAIADARGGHAFELSREFGAWRVSGGDPQWLVDVVRIRGGSIGADLRLRDFTINAVAAPIAGGDLIDPTGGIADCDARVLRAASERSFSDDPLRLLRAARLGAEIRLGIDAETLALARTTAPRAREASGERRFAELRGMLTGPDPLGALELLDRLDLTAFVLPELHALRGVVQSPNHHLDVHAHTIEVLRRWLEVEADLERFAGAVGGDVGAALAEPLADELTRGEGIRFAAILHDIGKPATREERDGFVSFRGHDVVGAEMVVELCAELRTSRRFAGFQAALTRNHLVLGFMVGERPLPRRRVWDYLQRTGREALDVTMLTIADRLAAQGSGVPQEAIAAHLELAREMLGEIVRLERAGAPQPLLSGDEIAELLSLEPGERIGAAVRELAAAQFAGEVADRTDAEAHLRVWASPD